MDKSLKKLSRVELLELMVQLSDECENLAHENSRLKQKLAQRRLPRNAKVGSIAEAALQANGYFEAAQRSADEYLREIKYLRDELALRSNRSPEEAREIVASAQEQSRVRARAQAQAQKTLKDAQARANQIVSSAQAQARAIMQEAQARSGYREVQPIAPLNGNQQAAQRFRQQNAQQPQRASNRQTQQAPAGRHGAAARQDRQVRQAQPARSSQQRAAAQGAHQRTGQQQMGQRAATDRTQASQQTRQQSRQSQHGRHMPADISGALPYQNLRPRPSTSGR